MTEIERIINEAVSRGIEGVVSDHASKAGEEIAKALLNDPTTRARYTTLIRKAIDTALENLDKPVP